MEYHREHFTGHERGTCYRCKSYGAVYELTRFCCEEHMPDGFMQVDVCDLCAKLYKIMLLRAEHNLWDGFINHSFFNS